VRKLPTRKLLAVLIAGALFVPTTGFTLGLGEIEVNSALNQRLNAEIELLSTTPEDTENIIVKLASRKEFSRAGLDRPYLLNDLRFKSEIIDGVAHIKVSSGSPIREPFINFLIEIDWPNGHLLREYTVLLDPPVFMTQTAKTTSVQSTDNSDFRPTTSASTNISPVVAAPIVTSASRPTEQAQPTPVKAAAPVSSEPTFIPAPVAQQQTPTKQSVASYRVKSGDTAWKLADAMRPNQNISVPQMLMAMLRANPESFINGNINGLKRGYIIRTPDAAQIAAISKQDARAMVSEHGALWRQYQQSKSGGQSASSKTADSKLAQTESSTNSTSAAMGKDNAHLAIVAGAGTSTAGGKDPANMSAEELRAELALSRERVETERVEKEALRNRVGLLEQRAVKTEGMLSIEDEELSAVQSLNTPVAESPSATETETADVEMAENASPGSTETGEDTVTDESATPEVATEETIVVTDEVAAVVSPEDAIFTDEVSGQNENADADASNTAVMPEAAEPVANDTDTESVADPLTELLNNPILLAAAGGGLLLFVLMIALINKRRKAGASMAAVATAPVASNTDTDLVDLADNIAEEKAVTEVAEEDTDVASSTEDLMTEVSEAADVVEAEPEPDVQAEEERDDVIAEADVYLAYGIYQQAEDLLKQALVDHPENDNYRAKLAETFYTSKNANAFLEVANELKQNVADDSAIWTKVSEMGKELCSDDPMFQGAMVADLDLDEVAPDELSMDFGSDDDGAVEELAEINLEVDDGSIELPDLDIEEQSVADDATAEMPDEPVEEIEFDLSDAEATVDEAASEDEFSLDIDASELDIKSEDEAIDETSAEEESFDIADIEIDLDEEISASEVSDADIDFNLDDVVETETETVNSEDDLEEIALDLSDDVEIESLESDSTENIDAVLAANDDSSEDGDFDLSNLDDADEISTKLDLARAYMDMGDHDGTRDILDEVLADGNDDQKQEANDLMQKLN
jgi:pilus assembly protein FimV